MPANESLHESGMKQGVALSPSRKYRSFIVHEKTKAVKLTSKLQIVQLYNYKEFVRVHFKKIRVYAQNLGIDIAELEQIASPHCSPSLRRLRFLHFRLFRIDSSLYLLMGIRVISHVEKHFKVHEKRSLDDS